MFRFRVPTPRSLDFARIAQGVIDNNMGIAAILVQMRGNAEGATFTSAGEAQRFALTAPVTASAAGSPWHAFRVDGWEKPATVNLHWLEGRPAPRLTPGTPKAEARK